MINFNNIVQGNIVLISFPYEDGVGSKIRPALVVSKDINRLELLILKITSKAPRTPYDYVLVDWEAAGLRQESVVRVQKQVVTPYGLVVRKLGTVSPYDYNNIMHIFNRTL